jgi:KUP system potassium uptake protein
VNRHATGQLALAIGALGVVFGDIGTSPLYTVQTVFSPGDPHPVKVSAENVFGTISLIFWSVTLIVTVTYVLLVMRADNDGEGGIMALITLIRRQGVPDGRGARPRSRRSGSSARRCSSATALSRRPSRFCPRSRASKLPRPH